MWIYRPLVSALLGALTLFAPLQRVNACGPFLPSRILTEKDSDFLELPYSTFAYEAKRVPAPYPPPFRAVAPTVGDSDTLGTAQAKQTEALDLDALAKALETTQPDSAQRQKILAGYTTVRQALTAHAQRMVEWKEQLWSGMPDEKPPPQPAPAPALTVPDGLPGEFADYLRGAIAYRQNQPDAARSAWQALLQRPADQRRNRSTWAAYMLGRSYLPDNPAEARRWFQQTRELAKEGYADRLGLAAASLGWEAQLDLQQGHYAPALEAFRVQLEAGDASAPISLLLATRRTVAKANPEARAECVKNPAARRLVTGYLLSASLLKDSPDTVTTWLNSLKNVDAPAEDADRLAWAAYEAGHFELARGWLTKAPAQAPIAQWLRAKLLLRDGKVAEALPLIAEVAVYFPRDPEFVISRDLLGDTEIFDARRAQAEIGALRLGRGEYVAALDALLQGAFNPPGPVSHLVVERIDSDHWPDAAYVAEQVLTLAELKEFVDQRWPNPAPPPVEGKTPGVDAQMRYLLARRLARQGMLDAAAPYYPADQQDTFRRYAEALRHGNNPNMTRPQHIEGLWTAAQQTREQGMALLGTESDPDWASEGGSFDLGTTTADRPKDGVNRAAPAELARAASNRPTPDRRFHYRFRAADLAWQAAQLMPDQSDQTALALVSGGNWIKNHDAKGAERFYKALVRRCSKTSLGKQAAAKHWLPDLTPPPAQ
ncbi:MAG: tetratricopeptide repeat protein [Candidatus Competibacteraceae bacterium]